MLGKFVFLCLITYAGGCLSKLTVLEEHSCSACMTSPAKCSDIVDVPGMWRADSNIVFYADTCVSSGGWLCRVCPMSLLPENGRFSERFYDNTVLESGMAYEYDVILDSVLTVAGESYCQKWVTCDAGYVLSNGICTRETVPLPKAQRIDMCPENHWCSDATSGICPNGTFSILGSHTCSTLSIGLPPQQSSEFVWATISCLKFQYAAERVFTVSKAFNPNSTDIAVLAQDICNSAFSPLANPEFLLSIPCLCKSVTYTDTERVEPMTLACKPDEYLSPGVTLPPAVRVVDHTCEKCRTRSEAGCQPGYYSPLCAGGFHYAQDKFFREDDGRFVLHRSAAPDSCLWPCDTPRPFEYFTNEGGIGDCLTAICTSCTNNSVVEYTPGWGFTEAFYTRRCSPVFPGSLECIPCRTTVQVPNVEAVIFEFAINYAQEDNFTCPWTCKIGYQKVDTLNGPDCVRCNSTTCGVGYHATACAYPFTDDLTPLCEPCNIPVQYLHYREFNGTQYDTGLGVAWQWADECKVQCLSGYYLDNDKICKPCPTGSTCDGSSSPQPCGPGNWTEAPNTCLPCAPGSYCSPTEGKRECNTPLFSEAGSYTIDNCSCAVGTVLVGGEVCLPCPNGFFCLGGLQACPNGTHSKPGAVSIDNCIPDTPFALECQVSVSSEARDVVMTPLAARVDRDLFVFFVGYVIMRSDLVRVAGRGSGSTTLEEEGSLLDDLFIEPTSLVATNTSLYVSDLNRGILRIILTETFLNTTIGFQAIGTCILLQPVPGVKTMILSGIIMYTHVKQDAIDTVQMINLASNQRQTIWKDTHIQQLTLSEDAEILLINTGTHNFTVLHTESLISRQETIVFDELIPFSGKTFLSVSGIRELYNLTIGDTTVSTQYMFELYDIQQTPVFSSRTAGPIVDFFVPSPSDKLTRVTIRWGCMQCPEGYHLEGEICLPGVCPRDHWCADGQEFTCPNGTVSPEGIPSRDSCVCVDGTFAGCAFGVEQVPGKQYCLQNIATEPLTLNDTLTVRPTFQQTWLAGEQSAILEIQPGVRCATGFRPNGCLRNGISVAATNEVVFFTSDSRIMQLKSTTLEAVAGVPKSSCYGIPADSSYVKIDETEVLASPNCLGQYVYGINVKEQVLQTPLLFALMISDLGYYYVIQYDLASGVSQRFSIDMKVVDATIPSQNNEDMFLLRREGSLAVFSTETGSMLSPLLTSNGMALYTTGTGVLSSESINGEGVYTLFVYAWNSPTITFYTVMGDYDVQPMLNVTLAEESGVETATLADSYLIVISHSMRVYFYSLQSLSVVHVVQLTGVATVEAVWATPYLHTIHLIVTTVSSSTLHYVTVPWDLAPGCTADTLPNMFGCDSITCLPCADGPAYNGQCFTCPNGSQAIESNRSMYSSVRRDCISTSERYWSYNTTTENTTGLGEILFVAPCLGHPCEDGLLVASTMSANKNIIVRLPDTVIAGKQATPFKTMKGTYNSITDMVLASVRGLFWISLERILVLDTAPTFSHIRMIQNKSVWTIDTLESQNYVDISAATLVSGRPLLFLVNRVTDNVVVCDITWAGSCQPMFPTIKGINSLSAVPKQISTLLACTKDGLFKVTPISTALLLSTDGNCTIANSHSDTWFVVSDRSSVFLYDFTNNDIIDVLGRAVQVVYPGTIYGNQDGIPTEMLYTPYIQHIAVAANTSSFYLVAGASQLGGNSVLRRVDMITVQCDHPNPTLSNMNNSRQCACSNTMCLYNGKCAAPPLGYYGSVSECLACPTGKTTVTPGECVCAPGNGLPSCSLCKIGTFQDGYNETCTACPPGSTTMRTGATSLLECVCLPGHYAYAGECLPCPNGFYHPGWMPANHTYSCYECPSNSSVDMATSFWDCAIPINQMHNASLTKTVFSGDTAAPQNITAVPGTAYSMPGLKPILFIEEELGSMWMVRNTMLGDIVYYIRLTFGTAVRLPSPVFDTILDISYYAHGIFIFHKQEGMLTLTRFGHPFIGLSSTPILSYSVPNATAGRCFPVEPLCITASTDGSIVLYRDDAKTILTSLQGVSGIVFDSQSRNVIVSHGPGLLSMVSDIDDTPRTKLIQTTSQYASINGATLEQSLLLTPALAHWRRSQFTLLSGPTLEGIQTAVAFGGGRHIAIATSESVHILTVQLQACPVNAFCVDGVAFYCPEGTYVRNHTCACNEGYFRDSDGECQYCMPNMWCTNETMYACPNGTISVNGTMDISSCLCPIGSYLALTSNGTECLTCPEFSSTASSNSIGKTACFCLPGYYYTEEACRPAPVGSYTAANSTAKDIVYCGDNYTTLSEATPADVGCVCAEGLYANVSGNSTVCVSCPSFPVIGYDGVLSPPGSASFDNCTCPPSSYLVDQTCVICPLGSYCPGDNQQYVCPDYASTTAPGAIHRSDCSCVHTAIGNVYGGCVPCPAGSIANYTSNNCTCTDGFYYTNDGCITCPEDHLCIRGQLIPCASTATTLGETGVYTEQGCKCKDNHYSPYTQQFNTFCTPCPGNASTYSIDVSQPCTCDDGFYKDNPNETFFFECVPCEPDFFCSSGKSVACPEYSSSASRSTSMYDCVCDTGRLDSRLNILADPNSTCALCPSLFYCPTSDTTLPCPGNSQTGAGVRSNIYDCIPLPGFTYTLMDGAWKACNVNQYCPTFNSSLTCDSMATSVLGSANTFECVCTAGMFKGLNEVHCKECPSGFFCPGPQPPLPCPVNTTSPNGSKSVQDCHCDCLHSGKKWYISDGQCLECPDGFDCKTGTICPVNKTCNAQACEPQDCGSTRYTIEEGSSSVIDCLCLPGYYTLEPLNLTKPCVQCPMHTKCVAGTLQACSNREWSAAGSTICNECPANTARRQLSSGTIQDCEAIAGFYSQSYGAQICPADSYCVAGSLQPTACPALRESAVGAQAVTDCYCRAGYMPGQGGYCFPCPANKVCLGNNQLWSCPLFTSTIGQKYSKNVKQCLPDAGYYTIGNSTDTFAVLPCPLNHYCLKDSNADPTPCPVNSEALTVGSTSCICVEGTYGPTCTECPVGSYCPAGTSTPLLCGDYGTTYETKQSKCQCLDGAYYNGSACDVCPLNSYCQDSLSRACPTGSISDPGATKCTPLPGYYWDWDDLRICPLGFYCNDNLKVPCPEHATTAEMGAASIQDCNCVGGYWKTDTLQCEQCPKNHYCSNTKSQCGPNQTSPVGSEKASDCVCAPGYTAMGLYVSLQCLLCPANYYCEGGTHKQKCDSYNLATSSAGSKLRTDCKPVAGYYRTEQNTFRACEPGYYCPSGGVRTACPTGSASLSFRSTKVTDCVCTSSPCNLIPPVETPPPCPNGTVWHTNKCVSTAGFYGMGTPCGIGFWCPYDQYDEQFACPYATNTSTTGAPSIDYCACPPGFTNNRHVTALCSPNCPPNVNMYHDDWIVCTECPEAYYCPLNTSVTLACPENRTSLRMSVSLDNCTCLPGYYGENCTVCPSDYYCIQGLLIPCPDYTYSANRSASLQDCRSYAGYYNLGTICPLGLYCDNNEAILCPNGSTTLTEGATTVDDCFCTEGYTLSNSSICIPCPAGYYCNGNSSATLCPENTEPSTDSTYCECKAGFFGDPCEPCPLDFYCPKNSTPIECSVNTSSYAIMTECRPTSKGLRATGEMCPSNSYCDWHGEHLCPPGSISVRGSISIYDCICTNKTRTPIATSANFTIDVPDIQVLQWDENGLFLYFVPVATPSCIYEIDTRAQSSRLVAGKCKQKPCQPEDLFCDISALYIDDGILWVADTGPTILKWSLWNSTVLEQWTVDFDPPPSVPCATLRAFNMHYAVCNPTDGLHALVGTMNSSITNYSITIMAAPSGILALSISNGIYTNDTVWVVSEQTFSLSLIQVFLGSYTTQDIPMQIAPQKLERNALVYIQGSDFMIAGKGTGIAHETLFANVFGTLKASAYSRDGHTIAFTTQNQKLVVSNTATDFECTACPDGYYCPEQTVAQICPPLTECVAPCTSLEHCQCSLPGTVMLEVCSPCPANHYCLGNNHSERCPNSTITTGEGTGATGIQACTYSPGTYWNHSTVLPCPAGFYCTGDGGKQECPTHSTSIEGASECVCEDGRHMVSSECMQCPDDSYCSGGSRHRCPLNAWAGMVGTTKADTCRCRAGYTHTDGVCILCPPGHYCNITKHVCPPYTFSLPGSVSERECLLDAGVCLYNTSVIACPEDHYCPFNRTECLPCPPNQMAPVNSTKCTCMPGTYSVGNTSHTLMTLQPYYSEMQGNYSELLGFHYQTYAVWRDKTGSLFKLHIYLNVSVQIENITITAPLEHRFFEYPSVLQIREERTPAECITCPAGSFCYNGQRTKCTPHSTAVEGSVSMYDCECLPGYRLIGLECMDCIPSYYCNGDMMPCPFFMSSPPLSTRIEDCVMPPGYHNASGVQPCPVDYYCPGGAVWDAIPCPPHSVSPEGSSLETDCFCVDGFFTNYSANPELQDTTQRCVQCPQDNYCQGGILQRCPAFSSSPPASVDVIDCICSDGRFPVNGSCSLCGMLHYCNDNVRLPCPTYSKSRTPDASNISACVCSSGFYMTNTYECKVCPSAFYCPGDNIQYSCKTQQTSTEGSTRAEQCVCPAGYYDSENGCLLCPYGSYCPGDNGIRVCPFLNDEFGIVEGVSQPGSISVYNCTCPVGTYLQLFPEYRVDTPWVEQCISCGEGYYCPDQLSRNKCPDNTFTLRTDSVSPHECLCKAEHKQTANGCNPCEPGSTTLGIYNTSCICTAGFTKNATDICVPCATGYYCPPDSPPMQCPPNQTSDVGAKDISMCYCIEGLYLSSQQCIQCPPDVTCIGGEQIRCPIGASYSTDRCVCNDGYYLNDQKWTCEKCGLNHFCVNGSRLACPNSMTTLGDISSSVSECLCDTGQYRTGEVCQQCQAGYYCTDGISMTACPTGQTSISPFTECICNNGTYPTENRDQQCKQCEPDFYCNNGDIHACPRNSWSLQGATAEDECICDTYFINNASNGTDCMIDPQIPTCMHLQSLSTGTVDILNLYQKHKQIEIFTAGDPSALIAVGDSQRFYHCTGNVQTLINDVLFQARLYMQEMLLLSSDLAFILTTSRQLVSLSLRENTVQSIMQEPANYTIIHATLDEPFLYVMLRNTSMHRILKYDISVLYNAQFIAGYDFSFADNGYTVETARSFAVAYELFSFLVNNTIQTLTLEGTLQSGCFLPDFGTPLHVIFFSPLYYIQYESLIIGLNITTCDYIILHINSDTRMRVNIIGVHFAAHVLPIERALYDTTQVFVGCQSCLNLISDPLLPCMQCSKSFFETTFNLYSPECKATNSTTSLLSNRRSYYPTEPREVFTLRNIHRPKAEPQPEPKAEPQSEPKAKPQPEPKAEPQSEPAHILRRALPESQNTPQDTPTTEKKRTWLESDKEESKVPQQLMYFIAACTIVTTIVVICLILLLTLAKVTSAKRRGAQRGAKPRYPYSHKARRS